ncbi:hypothetical protein [Actinomyces israelii]|uniref:DUF4352 domain-containing protein n=1 Tax=Actinomyces israelii TaxID=1659 RepID=A0ABT4ICN1_9ACTO|nr:hypothetical protein [Actinomyces israelii]MCZ0859514.1 hypothetical protein [Actinomyces israelii]WKR21592.1 hypothetical protein AIF0345_1515 [Actinomyces israelii]
MALRFNPPPNWPAPPEGFNPPAGWQPDPAWGPAPEGWQLWVEDSVPGGGSGPQTSSEADAAWAPTQAVPSSSSSPVADPTGQSASAPSGDYAASGPVVGSGPAPVVGSGPGASPYAPGMNYAQAPTPYHNQGMPAPGGPVQGAPGGLPQGPGWQPVNVAAQGGSKSIIQQWWFWLIIGLLVIALVGGGLYAILRNGNDSDSDNNGGGGTTTSATPDAGAVGTSEKNPYPPSQTVTVQAGSTYTNGSDASVDVTFGVVNWDATQQFRSVTAKVLWTEPPSDKVYIRVPVTVTYHGSGQLGDFDVHISYVRNGNTTDAVLSIADDEYREQNMPHDGGSATGYATFLVTREEAQSKEGVWTVSGLSNYDDQYIKVRNEN